MNKRLVSLFVALSMMVGMFIMPGMAGFQDIPDPEMAIAAAVLQSAGIADGTSTTTFNPGGTLTRSQFCTFAVRTMGLQDKVAANTYKTLFSDVKPGQWYTGYVNLAYGEGIINGYGNGLFGPEDGITYGQVATILLRILGYTSAEVGKVWPADYVSFAKEIELSKGLNLDANSIVTRGQAAVLIYNTLKATVNNGSKKYYETINGVVRTEGAIVLDNNATSGSTPNNLMVCPVNSAQSTVEYYKQKHQVSDDLVGQIGTLLLDSSGKSVGFIPDSAEYKDVKVSSAKSSSITATNGEVYRVSGSASVIYNGSLYSYGDTGYLQVNNQTGKNVRLYYNEEGAIHHIYISAGSSAVSTAAVVAETTTAASELARRLGIASGEYTITKNGAIASAGDLAKNDVAYYESATKTMRVSDYKISGYIETAVPSVEAAQRITIAGCTLDVLESAWTFLEKVKLGSFVTLVLTDDNKVAGAFTASQVPAEMIGVLSMDGTSVTLSDSGLKVKANTMTAPETLRGTLVRVSVASKTALSCSGYSQSSNLSTVNISARTMGNYNLAPSCAIYEQAGAGATPGYIYSLAGVQGASSKDFNEVKWTKSIPSANVRYYRLNGAGQIDILVLRDVTGNAYQYGKLRLYADQQGINLGSGTWAAWNDAVTITNSSNPTGSQKYLASGSSVDQYGGIALATQTNGYTQVASVAKLTSTSNVAASSFFQHEDDWYVTASNTEVLVSGNVQVHIVGSDRWLSGSEGVAAAVSSGLPLTIYYDKSLTTGAQVRIIVVQGQN